MIDIANKTASKRTAIAQGIISMDDHAFRCIETNSLPKGNVLALAEVAGITAAKNASSTILLCHPLPLDYVRVSFALNSSDCSILAICEASAIAKTGVEMEALAGVSGALLAIYDLTKGVCPDLNISDVRLNIKKGGKSGTWTHPKYTAPDNSCALTVKSDTELPSCNLQGISAAVLTISDSVSQGTAIDKSGEILNSFLNGSKATVVAKSTVADEPKQILDFIDNCTTIKAADLILTTGGTGISSRDITPETIAQTCNRLIPGIGELLRQSGQKYSKYSHISRSVAGLKGKTLIISLPGSPSAVTEALYELINILPHSLRMARDNTKHDKNSQE